MSPYKNLAKHLEPLTSQLYSTALIAVKQGHSLFNIASIIYTNDKDMSFNPETINVPSLFEMISSTACSSYSTISNLINVEIPKIENLDNSALTSNPLSGKFNKNLTPALNSILAQLSQSSKMVALLNDNKKHILSKLDKTKILSEQDRNVIKETLNDVELNLIKISNYWDTLSIEFPKQLTYSKHLIKKDAISVLEDLDVSKFIAKFIDSDQFIDYVTESDSNKIKIIVDQLHNSKSKVINLKLAYDINKHLKQILNE